MQSQVLFAFIQLRLPEALDDGAGSVDQLAATTGIPPESMASLLRAATALDLCQGDARGQYRLGDLGAVLIENPGVTEMVRHHDAFYKDLAEPLKLLRTAGNGANVQRYWSYAGAGDTDAENVADYTALMAASQEAVTGQVLAAVDLGNCKHLLDLGGGNACFAVAAVRKWPRLRVTVADLPPVIEAADKNITDQGLTDRIDTVALDFKQQSIPGGHDALSLVRILHDHDDHDVCRLLEAAAASLPDNGLLLVAEPLAESSAAGRLLEAYFSMYFLAMGQGRLRRQGELKALLEAAGFHRIRRAKTPIPLIASVVSARCKAEA